MVWVKNGPFQNVKHEDKDIDVVLNFETEGLHQTSRIVVAVGIWHHVHASLDLIPRCLSSVRVLKYCANTTECESLNSDF